MYFLFLYIVLWDSKEQTFPVPLLPFGYTHKEIHVQVFRYWLYSEGEKRYRTARHRVWMTLSIGKRHFFYILIKIYCSEAFRSSQHKHKGIYSIALKNLNRKNQNFSSFSFLFLCLPGWISNINRKGKKGHLPLSLMKIPGWLSVVIKMLSRLSH